MAPDSSVYRDASLWCENPNYRTDMGSHYFAVPKGLPQGVFLICGDRAWTGVPSLPLGGPCTLGKLTVLDPATPIMPKRVNEEPDPLQLKSKVVSLLTINSAFEFGLLDKLDNITFKNKPKWAVAKYLEPIDRVFQDTLLDSHIPPNYRAAIDYFMLARTVGCVEKPNLCCLNFRNSPNNTKFAFYSITDLKNLFTAAKVPPNFYSKDIFESVHIPFLPNWLKQICLICLSSAFTYSLSFLKQSIVKRVFLAQKQNKKGGDVGDGEGTYMDMDEWRNKRDKETNFDVWKVHKDKEEAGLRA